MSTAARTMQFSLRTLLVATAAVAIYIGSFLALTHTLAPERASGPLEVVRHNCDLPLFVLWCLAGEWAFRRRSSAPSARLMLAAIIALGVWRLLMPFVQVLLHPFLELNVGDVGVLQWYGFIATLLYNIVEFASWLLMVCAVVQGVMANPEPEVSSPRQPETTNAWRSLTPFNELAKRQSLSIHFSLRTLLIVTTAAAVYIGSYLALARTVRPQRALTAIGIFRSTFGMPIFVLWCLASEWAFRRRSSSSAARLMLAAILTIVGWRVLAPFAQAFLFRFITLNSDDAWQWYGVIAALLGSIFEFASWLLMICAVIQALKACPDPGVSSSVVAGNDQRLDTITVHQN